jgi:hypothetical protein
MAEVLVVFGGSGGGGVEVAARYSGAAQPCVQGFAGGNRFLRLIGSGGGGGGGKSVGGQRTASLVSAQAVRA